jgi:5-methyltetrahydropteroyltriglutamate--homocysteine methyltransferase
MSTLVSNHSSYPRIGETPEEQKLRRAIDRWEKKEISDDELEGVVQAVIAEAILQQEKAGVDLVTDGQVRWYDPISHWMRGLKGVKIEGLLRFFDTNCYFRVPKVEKPLEPKEVSFVRQDLSLSLKASKKPVKAVLTGPITLAFLSEKGTSFGKIDELTHALTSLMATEISGLASEGASWIQIEEPILLKKPEFFPVLAKSLKALVEKKGRAKILLATYFADAAPFYGKLQDLPVDGLGLDCVYGPGLLEKVAKEGSNKVLSLGIVDGRSTGMEKVETLLKPLRRIRLALNENGAKELHLTSSCGLEYLPRVRAFEKLSLLARLRDELL